MNGMDKNQTIGLVLISAMLIIYFSFFSPDPVKEIKPNNTTKIIVKGDTENLPIDTAYNKSKFGELSTFATGENKESILENEDIKVYLSTKGGKITKVFLKKYKTYLKEPLILGETEFNKQEFILPLEKPINIYDLYFTNTLTQGNLSLEYMIDMGQGKKIIQNYSIDEKNGFQIHYNLKTIGFDNQLKSKELVFNWETNLRNTEKDMAQSRLSANVCYSTTENGFNSLNETSTDIQDEKINESTNWVSFKQKFFTMSLIAPNNFSSASIHSEINNLDSTSVKKLSTSLLINSTQLEQAEGLSLNFFYGPNKLSVVKSIPNHFENNVYFGWPVINLVNRYIVTPVFNILEKVFTNYGIIIVCLVLLIKLVLLPLSYKAYYSMAKMKVMKPELDEIKAQLGDDAQAVQQAQMKLYQQVGINPLSGCIPILLQMPVLLAMFNFFPNSIELRQQPFLWAEDLSTYDSIYNFGYMLPFYGDHISLFTLLMTASTLLYTWYNNQISTATGPMLAMSYVMPLIFMFVLNSMPAGLSIYYFVSNMVTILQQFVIKRFVDEDELKLKLEANKTTAHLRKKNRFQQRLEDAMKAQQDIKKK